MKAVECSTVFYGDIQASYVRTVFWRPDVELSTVFSRFSKKIKNAVECRAVFCRALLSVIFSPAFSKKIPPKNA